MTRTAGVTSSELPIVALVGRVNVGKSTLFNRVIEEQKALISAIPGTTRTNNEGIVLWRGSEFQIIDTGGLTFEDDVLLEEKIMQQSERAMKQCDLVVFVVNGKDGVMPQEKELAKRMRRIIAKPVILVANKVDNARIERQLPSLGFDRLGLGEPFLVSATSGRGVGDLLDHITEQLISIGKAPTVPAPKINTTIRVSIIGKPNVGKSSLFNKLIGLDKVIVSDLPHTTREPHDTCVTYTENETDHSILFIDTAGIRRKNKVAGELERRGIQKSIQAVETSDIILFVLDGIEPFSHQDKQLAGLLEKRGKSVIILLNKWDLSEDRSDAKRKEITALIIAHFPHLDFAPILFVSGKTGAEVHKIFPVLLHAARARHTEVPKEAVTTFFGHILHVHRPARGKGTRQPKLLGFYQIATDPPVFELLVKQKTSLHTSYVHFIQNKLREQFDFFATPIIIRLTKMKR